MTPKKMIISLMLGIAISAIAFYLAFRNIRFDELGAYLIAINYLWIIPSVAAILFSFAFRAWRWQIILSSNHDIKFWQAFHPLMIGFMLNCILPGRVGEVARPIILQQKDSVPFSTGLATVATERVFDTGLLLILFFAVLTMVNIDPAIDIPFGKYHLNKETLEAIGSGMIKLSLVLIIGIMIFSFSKSRELIKRTIIRIPSLFFFAEADFKEKVKEKLCFPLINIVENFASGFSLLKYPKKILICAGLSVIIWSSAIFSYYIFMFGCPDINLSFAEISAVLVIICFFIALPSVPGYWGIWEAGGVFALALFGVSSKDAAAFTLANHAIQLFPVIIVGFISAMLTGVSIWQISYEKKE